LEDIDVLVDTVSSPAVPAIHVSLLRRNTFYELAQLMIENVPSQPDMTFEGQ
jgi:hypothetical protein